MALRGLLLGVLLLLLLAGCSGAAATAESGTGQSPFILNVWDESLVGSTRAVGFTYWLEYPDANWATVDIQVIGAIGLKALYFDLTYDATRLEPVGVDFNDNIAPEALRLESVNLSQPGRVIASQVASGVTALGFTGSGKLARVIFRRK
jgi:hypothetical protein